MNDTPPPSPDQPPYDSQRYAPYTPEPWDDQPQPRRPVGVWYGFVALTVAVMVLGAMLVLSGYMFQTNPAEVLRALSNTSMKSGFHNQADVVSKAPMYYSLGAFYFVAGAIAFMIPHSIGRWIYGILLIVISVSTCFLAPFSLIMFIFWMLPSTRSYFASPKA